MDDSSWSKLILTLVLTYLGDTVALNFLLHWSQEDKDDAYTQKLDALCSRIDSAYKAVSSLCSLLEVSNPLPEVPACGDKRRLQECIRELYLLAENLGYVQTEQLRSEVYEYEQRDCSGGSGGGARDSKNIDLYI